MKKKISELKEGDKFLVDGDVCIKCKRGSYIKGSIINIFEVYSMKYKETFEICDREVVVVDGDEINY